MIMGIHNITSDSLSKFFKDNNIKYKKDRLLLSEALRRKHFLGNDNDTWVGLGKPSYYKSIYFRTHDGDMTPRISHWWVLTNAGLDIMKKMEEYFTIPSNYLSKDKINTFLFNLHYI